MGILTAKSKIYKFWVFSNKGILMLLKIKGSIMEHYATKIILSYLSFKVWNSVMVIGVTQVDANF